METDYFQRQTNRLGLSTERLRQVAVGDTITYLLSPAQQPTNPLRQWHGRVEKVYGGCVSVVVLDDGYTGEVEMVRETEILSIIS